MPARHPALGLSLGGDALPRARRILLARELGRHGVRLGQRDGSDRRRRARAHRRDVRSRDGGHAVMGKRKRSLLALSLVALTAAGWPRGARAERSRTAARLVYV